MPLYYFHTHLDTPGFDVESQEMADDTAARNEAVQLLVDLVDRQLQVFWRQPHCWVTVCDERGDEIATVEIRQASSRMKRQA